MNNHIRTAATHDRVTVHHGSLTAVLARRGFTHRLATHRGPGIRAVVNAGGVEVTAGTSDAVWEWVRQYDCACEPHERDECMRGRFKCAVCDRTVPACCGAADEHETEGVGVSGVCDDCAAQAAWERELW